jgi:hypothetical protein
VVSEVRVVVVADYLDYNLVVEISEIVEVVVVVSSMPQLFSLEPRTSINMVSNNYLPALGLGKRKLIFEPVCDKSLFATVERVVIESKVHAVHTQDGELRSNVNSVVPTGCQSLLN